MNTLFVRTILLSMLVLISVHVCVTLLVSEPAAGGEDRALQTAVFTGRAFANDPLDSAGGTWGAPVKRISLVPATMKLDLAARPGLSMFARPYMKHPLPAF